MSILLMTAAWRTTLPTGQKMVLLALADNANDRGECYPSVQTMATKCSMSERAVQGHLAALEKAGVVARDMRPGRSTLYTIDPRKLCTPADDAPPQKLRPTPADSVKTPANPAPAPADPAPITITQPPEPPGNRQSQDGDPPAPPPPPPPSEPEDPPEFVEAWACYPKRAGGNSRKDALKAWKARVAAGADPAAMLAGVKRYAAYCEGTDKVGTAYVKQAATFFGPGDHYLDEWPLPKPASRNGYTHNLSGMDYSRGVDDDGRF